MSSRIEALARRVESDPFFLASALADYARSERLDEQGLAAALGCAIDTLALLRLCRRPRPNPVLFRDDVATIATRFDVDAGLLAEMVRRSDALARLRQGARTEGGLLMAARDREDHETATPEAGETDGGLR